jgi:hypothetical protein
MREHSNKRRLALALIAAVVLAVPAAAPAATFNEKVTINNSPEPLLATDGAGHNLFSVQTGGAEQLEGGIWPAIYIPNGDILNLRNLQGGYIGPGAEADDLNLDIGAGNDVQRGNVALNWDVGNAVIIYDGRKSEVASFNVSNNQLVKIFRELQVSRTIRASDGIFASNGTTRQVAMGPYGPQGQSGIVFGQGTVSNPFIYLYYYGTNLLKTDQRFLARYGIGVGNNESHTTDCQKKGRFPIYDANNTHIGYVPITDC